MSKGRMPVWVNGRYFESVASAYRAFALDRSYYKSTCSILRLDRTYMFIEDERRYSFSRT